MFASRNAVVVAIVGSALAIAGLSGCGTDSKPPAAQPQVTTTAAPTTTTAAPTTAAPSANVPVQTVTPRPTQTATPSHSTAPKQTSAPKTKPAASIVSNGAVMFMLECSSENRVQRPSSYAVECGPQHKQLQGLRWTNWGARTATATGNWMEPTGAKGRSYPVTVTAGAVERGEATMLYRTLTVRFDDGFPDGMSKSVTYQLNW